MAKIICHFPPSGRAAQAAIGSLPRDSNVVPERSTAPGKWIPADWSTSKIFRTTVDTGKSNNDLNNPTGEGGHTNTAVFKFRSAKPREGFIGAHFYNAAAA